MKKYFFILLATLCLVSCEEVIDFNGDESEQKVVMNSMAQGDSTLNVRLTLSRFFLSNKPFSEITDANLTLVVNGNQYVAVNDTKGDYHFNYQPKGGDVMTIEAQVPGHDAVKAVTVMPYKPNITDASMTLKGEVENYEWGGYSRLVSTEVKFKLHDPAGERNYYRLRVIALDTVSYWDYRYNTATNRYDDSVLVRNPANPEGNASSFSIRDLFIVNEDALGTVVDAIVGSADQGLFEGRELLFTDDRIDGQTHEMVVLVNNYNWGNQLQSIKPDVKVIVESISEDLYYYIVSRNKQQDDVGAGIISEPYRIHCNVEGGIGIFGATNKVEYRKQLPETLMDDLFSNGK